MTRKDIRGFSRQGVNLSLCLFSLLVPLTIAGANISWGVLLAGLMAFAAAGGALPRRAWRSAIEKPLWFFFFVSLFTAAAGVDPSYSLGFLHQDFHKVWLYLLFSTALALEPAPWVPGFMAAGMAAAAFIGIFQNLGSLSGSILQQVRAHAFVHPVTFGEQMAVAALGGLAFWLRPPEGWSRSRRRAALALLLVATTALVLSNTRGALIALFCGAAAILLSDKRLRRFFLILLPVCLAVFLAVESLRIDRALILGRGAPASLHTSEGNQSIRLTLWRIALRVGADNPLTGVGQNNFRKVFSRYAPDFTGDGTEPWGTAHNLYLHHFAERGLIGLGALLWLFYAFWTRAWARVRESAQPWNLWALGTTTAFLVMNVTEVALQVEILWMLVFFVWIWAEARHASHGSGAAK